MTLDDVGNVTRLEVDALATVGGADLILDRAFDALNRITQVSDAGQTTSFFYESGCGPSCGSSGHLTGIQRANGIETAMRYDSRGRLTNLRNQRQTTSAALSLLRLHL